MYHALGIAQVHVAVSRDSPHKISLLIDLVSSQASCGVILATFRPQFPAIIPSSDKVFEDVVATKTDISLSVPTFLEVI